MYYVISFLVLTTMVYIFVLIIKGKRLDIVKLQNKDIPFISNVSKYLEELKKRNILLKGKKWITPINILCMSVLFFVLSIIVLNLLIGVLSTAIILSLPILFSPAIITKILIKNNKRKIVSCLPMYAINLKNYITEDNNIISAIMKATVEPPLDIFIYNFRNNVLRGMNVLEALDILEKDVRVKEFSELILGIKLCYINGGDFASILEKYISIITKEATHKAETEEKAFSSIITLFIMVALNLIVVFFVMKNSEYANIVRTTFVGKLILNFNAISYMVIAGLVGKIYKEE